MKKYNSNQLKSKIISCIRHRIYMHYSVDLQSFCLKYKFYYSGLSRFLNGKVISQFSTIQPILLQLHILRPERKLQFLDKLSFNDVCSILCNLDELQSLKNELDLSLRNTDFKVLNGSPWLVHYQCNQVITPSVKEQWKQEIYTDNPHTTDFISLLMKIHEDREKPIINIKITSITKV